METYTASRLTGGNEIFPAQIILDETSVTLNDPGLFNGIEKTVPYGKIASVDVEIPLIGFSTIIIETSGEGSIKMHGFTKDEVTKIKKTILEKMK
ncbi:MAG: PH domain-containing protein [Bacteroidia bacterium]|nr:PH domain-containing protein [Bacteroidia bacterium]